MSRSRRIGALDLRSTINAMFLRYGNEVNLVIDDALKEVARESVEDLKAVRSFSSKGNPSGDYSKDWTWEIEPVKRYSRRIVVFNEDHYRLTHLLESGHAKWLWGHPTGQSVRGFSHIEPVEKKASEHLENAIERRLEEIDV
jgi:hypothetical protein